MLRKENSSENIIDKGLSLVRLRWHKYCQTGTGSERNDELGLCLLSSLEVFFTSSKKHGKKFVENFLGLTRKVQGATGAWKRLAVNTILW